MSRTAEIPDNLMVKWQSGQSRGNKAARRPKTACQTCRASKVRCDGKPRCSHCTLRGVACIYNRPKSVIAAGANGTLQNSNQQAQQQSTAADGRYVVAWPAPPPPSAWMAGETTRRVANPDSSDNGMVLSPNASLSGGRTAYQDTPELNDMILQMNGESTTTEPTAVYEAQPPEFHMPLDLASSFDMTSSTSAPDYNTAALSSTCPSSDTESSGHSSTIGPVSSSSSSNSPSGGVFFSAHCVCRDKLSHSVGDINSAMADNTMHDIFHVTSEFMRSCRGILDCRLCTVQCADLVCLLSLVQQTGSCFHYVAATDPRQQSIELRFAGAVVRVTDPRMRLMAVTHLVQQAVDVLDAMGDRGRAMLQALSPPTPLALTNIGYLENTIGEFKGTLDRVVAIAEQSASEYA